MEQIHSYLSQAIADETQLKAHYGQIAHNQQNIGNFEGWALNSSYAMFTQNLINRLNTLQSMLSETSEIEDQLWC